jgi:hypothetical protein
MKKYVRISLFSLLIVTVLACEDDEKSATGCQSCVNDYCSCVEGETNAQVRLDCAESASTCVSSKCTTAEAQDIDYTSCGNGNGGTDTTDGTGSTDKYNPGSCGSCVDDFCVCSHGVTDAQVMAICTQASVDCAAARCTPEETSNLNFNVCDSSDTVSCQGCIDTYCVCLEQANLLNSYDVDACNNAVETCTLTFCANIAQDDLNYSCIDDAVTL